MLKNKYPQKFKKQHKKRQNRYNSLTLQNEYASFAAPTRYGIFTPHNSLIPTKLISFFRKTFKKFFKKKKIKCWFRVTQNKTISSKPKNSRMGKGVGTINRVGFTTRPQAPLFVFENISSRRVLLLALFITKRYPISLKRVFVKKV